MQALEVKEMDKLRSQVEDLREELAQVTKRVATLESRRVGYSYKY